MKYFILKDLKITEQLEQDKIDLVGGLNHFQIIPTCNLNPNFI